MRIAQSGYRVLVSKATEIPLETGKQPDIEVRSGPLGRAAPGGKWIDQRGDPRDRRCDASVRGRGPRDGKPRGPRQGDRSLEVSFVRRVSLLQRLGCSSLRIIRPPPLLKRLPTAAPSCSPREREILRLTLKQSRRSRSPADRSRAGPSGIPGDRVPPGWHPAGTDHCGSRAIFGGREPPPHSGVPTLAYW